MKRCISVITQFGDDLKVGIYKRKQMENETITTVGEIYYTTRHNII